MILSSENYLQFSTPHTVGSISFFNLRLYFVLLMNPLQTLQYFQKNWDILLTLGEFLLFPDRKLRVQVQERQG